MIGYTLFLGAPSFGIQNSEFRTLGCLFSVADNHLHTQTVLKEITTVNSLFLQ